MKAGVTRVTITPPVGMYLPGMERPDDSHGVRDDVYATALAVSDGTTETVIVSLDALLIHPEYVARLRKICAEQTGIDGENIMFCATHCHSGPITFANERNRPMFYHYVETLAHLLTGVVRMAHDRMVPAKVGFGTGVSTIGMNRRLTLPNHVTVIRGNPDGPVDHEVGVMRIDTAGGQPLAVVVNYACHPVVLGNGSNVISADWPGAMRRTVEKITGATLLYIQGAAADINPWPGEPTDSEEILEKLGTSIGGEVVSTWSRIEAEPVNEIRAEKQKVWIPLQPVSEYAGKVPEFVEMAEATNGMSYEQLQEWIDEMMPWSVELKGEGDDQKAGMEMQAFRFGDIALVTAGAEIFVKTGLAVKNRSPFEKTMFAGYTNGSVSYIPLPEDFPRGGYEVNEAYMGYRLPAPVHPTAAGVIEDAAVDLLKKLNQ